MVVYCKNKGFIKQYRWVLVLVLGLVLFLFSKEDTLAATVDIETSNDWDSGVLEDLVKTDPGLGIEVEADGTWGALTWKTPDKYLSAGSAFTSDGTNIYVTRGLGDTIFWKYSTVDGTWETLESLPCGTYYGSDIQYLDGYVYALFGGYQKTFARYSVENDSWAILEEYAELTFYGSSMTTDGTDIFAVTANNTQGFYKYSVSGGSWTTLAGTPANLRHGADLEYVGGYIYTPRGANTNYFYRYEIATSTWTTMANLPGTMYDDVDITSHNGALYVARQYNTSLFYKYDIATNTWSTLANAPMNSRYAGVQYVGNDGYIYFFRGNNDYRFWKYDIEHDEFIGPADSPSTLYTGSDMVYSDGYVYTLRGYNQAVLYRYHLATNTWETMEPCPTSFYDDVRGVSVGTDIYWYRGSNTTTFYRYSTTTNTWAELSNTPAGVRYGGALAYPGSGDYLYATRGSTTNTFWRYIISTDTWEPTAVADLPSGIRAGYGATLLSDGTDIFFTSGQGTSRMYKYVIATDTWTQLTDMPFATYYGTDTTYNGDGKILALAGVYRKDLWEYTILTDAWRKLESFFGYRQTDYGTWAGASIEYDENGSFYVTRGGNIAEVLVYTPGVNDYKNNGSWLSSTYDLNYVASWNSVSVTADTPGDSYYTIQTRTSADSINWSDWESVSGSDIVSPTNKYLELKVLAFSSTGNAETPIVKTITIDYVSDVNPPSQPSNIVGKSQEVGGSDLTSGEEYGFTNPSFSWDAATDAETQIVGYYVYFGSNSNADPVANGSFQTTETYTVTRGIDVGSNYLRIISEDTLGNRSQPLAAFEYDYGGVGPVISLDIENADLLGENSSTQVTGSGVKLESRAGGFWQQERLTRPPERLGYGTKNVAYVASTNKLYVPRGMNNYFYEYDIDADAWTQLANAPATIYYGGGAVEGPDGYIYVARGHNNADFWRYDIENNTWNTDISNAPLTIGYGGSLVYDGSQYIYVLRGNNSDVFWRYDTFEDAWETLSKLDFGAPNDAVNNRAYLGASLAFDIENQLIYATQGYLRDGFSVYNINEDTWTLLPKTPALPYYGGTIEYYPAEESIYFMSGYLMPYLYKYDIASQEWTQMQSAPYGFYYGGGIHRVSDCFYAVRGGNSTLFYKYDIKKDSWLIPQRGLFGREFEGSSTLNTYYGADIVKGDGDNYYVTRGYFSDYFVRWNSVTGEITDLASTAAGLYYGASMVYESTNNKIYLTSGIYESSFFVYDIATNTWSEEVQDPTPYTSGYGSSMVYDGSRYIYWNRGQNNNYLYRYDTQEVAGSRWAVMTHSPAGLGFGAELLLKDGFIYTLRGQNVTPNPLYKYDIALDSWSTLASYPEQIYNDGFMADGNDGYFYAARGANTSVFYKYHLETDTWSQAPDFPGQIYAGGSGESNLTNAIYVLSGNGSNTYQDALYTYIMQTDNSSFVNEGNYVSQEHDLTSVYKWANLVVDYGTPNNTNLTIETSSSGDQAEWSAWVSVTREKEIESEYTYKINSPVGRFLKVRYSLASGDGILSPTISSYSVNYYQDLTPPENPETAGLVSLGSTDPEEPIITDNWYNYSSPQFTWADAEEEFGATDGANGSGVAGYHVYWGTDSEADPELQGSPQTETTFTPTDLEDPSTYYLRVRTADEAGNISSETWSPFIYKYDSSGPIEPPNLTADPAGFTAIDDFSFSWDAVETVGAQVVEYCYKTGAEEGDYSTDQCIEDLTISSIPSYIVGTNTFYVRVHDEAGNYSEYATVNYFYVDAENAPAPPTNLQVQPETNTENSFGFTWDPPLEGTYYGSQSNLSYLYSVNALPTEFSVSATSLRYLNPGAYATLPGENIFYIVSKDEAGNVNYNNYVSVSFSANTIAPGIPINIEIADVSVKSTQSWRLAISWDEPEDVGSGVAGYQIFRSVDGENFDLHTFTSGASLVDSKLIQVMYYYRARGCDSTNNCGAFSEIVSYYPDGRYVEPAGLMVEPIVSNITPKKATISWVTARTADSKVAFGVEPGVYFEEEVSNSDHMVDHVLLLNNLEPGTKYYYVARWTDEDGNTGVSDESTFETSPPPSIEEPIVKRIGLNSALIEFTTRDASKVRILYGETTTFGGMIEIYTGTAEGTHNVELTGIKDGTKYFYKINTFDVDGSEYEGEVHSFETLPRPRVSDVKIFQVSGTSTSTLLIEWESNTPISSLVTYYPADAPERALDEVNVSLRNGKHRMILINLDANTLYSIIINGRDFMGNEATSGIQSFTTAMDTRPPQVFDFEVTSEIIGSGQEATAQLVVSYKTDEPATSQVEYGEGTGTAYSQKTQEDANLSEHHIVIVSGLAPSKVYHLRSISKDPEGNAGNSVDKVIVTSTATENALDIVIKNLTSIFSFVGN
ncbi:MAG: hypothetical protein U9Q67_00335 [Patescibacteria group bacterium]|nr:hypothetical protein [Patescibacteria group bacterium]